MKNIFRLDADKSGSVSFRELVIYYNYVRPTSFSKDIVLKWVFKSCIELEKCPKVLIEKWRLLNSKHFVTTPGIFWKLRFLLKQLNRFSTMLIKIKMDLLHTSNISNLLKNTFAWVKLNSMETMNQSSKLSKSQSFKDHKDSPD